MKLPVLDQSTAADALLAEAFRPGHRSYTLLAEASRLEVDHARGPKCDLPHNGRQINCNYVR